MSPRHALFLLSCVTLLGTPVAGQSSSPGSSTAASSSAARATNESGTTNEIGRRGQSQPAVRTKATPPKGGKKGQARTTTPRAKAGKPAPAAKSADCDVAEVPVKAAPPAPVPTTADLLSPTVTPCPPGQPAAGKP